MKRRLRIQAAVMFLGFSALLGATFVEGTPPVAVALICAGVVPLALGNFWMSVQHGDTRRSLVALVTKVEMDQVPSYFAHLVPADVLAEAFPEPAESSSPTEEKA